MTTNRWSRGQGRNPLVLLLFFLAACHVGGGGAQLSATGLGEGGGVQMHAGLVPNSAAKFWGLAIVQNTGKSDAILDRAELLTRRDSSPGLAQLGFVVMRSGEKRELHHSGCGPFPPPNWRSHSLKGCTFIPKKSFPSSQAYVPLKKACSRSLGSGFTIATVRVSKVSSCLSAWRLTLEKRIRPVRTIPSITERRPEHPLPLP